MNHVLHYGMLREDDRYASPWARVIDSQSAKTMESGGLYGDDAGKKVTQRKRHIVTDTEEKLVHAAFHADDIQDRDGAPMAAMLATNSGRLCGDWGNGPLKSSSGQTPTKASRCCPAGGLPNAHWHGAIECDISPRASNKTSNRHRHDFLSHPFNFSRTAMQEHEIKPNNSSSGTQTCPDETMEPAIGDVRPGCHGLNTLAIARTN